MSWSLRSVTALALLVVVSSAAQNRSGSPEARKPVLRLLRRGKELIEGLYHAVT
jgi:hypothetical protein